MKIQNNLQNAILATNVTIAGKTFFSSLSRVNNIDDSTANPRLLLGVDISAKLSNFNSCERYRHTQALSFRDDGSIVLKYGSTTIIKNGSTAVIKGSLINSFSSDKDQNIKLAQDFFLNSLKKIKSTYNINKDVYDESTPILTIKYVKICKMLVVESSVDPESSG